MTDLAAWTVSWATVGSDQRGNRSFALNDEVNLRAHDADYAARSVRRIFHRRPAARAGRWIPAAGGRGGPMIGSWSCSRVPSNPSYRGARMRTWIACRLMLTALTMRAQLRPCWRCRRSSPIPRISTWPCRTRSTSTSVYRSLRGAGAVLAVVILAYLVRRCRPAFHFTVGAVLCLLLAFPRVPRLHPAGQRDVPRGSPGIGARGLRGLSEPVGVLSRGPLRPAPGRLSRSSRSRCWSGHAAPRSASLALHAGGPSSVRERSHSAPSSR